MVASGNSPPKTIRRKSFRSSVRDAVVADVPVVPAQDALSAVGEVRHEELSEIVLKLRSKLKTALKRIMSAYTSKIAAASDPEYPRSEVVQQMKQAASSMYTACQYICFDACDVSDESVIIMYCFGICVEILFRATFQIIAPEKVVNFLEIMTLEILNDARRKGSSSVPFTDSDVESYVMTWVKRWGLEESGVGSGREDSPKIPLPDRDSTPQTREQVVPMKSPSRATRRESVRQEIDLNEQAVHLIDLLGRVGYDKSLVGRATELSREFVEQVHGHLAQVRKVRAANRFSQESQLV